MGLLENIIACFYDCDQTLIPGYMQEPLFRHYGIEPELFWKEADQLAEDEKKKGVNLDQENAYLNLLLDYTEKGTFSGLSQARLGEFGAQIRTYNGLPEFFVRTKRMIETEYATHRIMVEHYIVSTGLKEMIRGSPLNAPGCLAGIYASEFIEKDGLIKRIARAVGHLKKTEFLFMVNKGANLYPEIDVNKRMAREDRRVPFENMIYVGDGFTDVPCFAIVTDRGGRALAVYNPESEEAFRQAYSLREENRVFGFGPADYSPGSHTSRWIEHTLHQIAKRIVHEKRCLI